MRIRATSWAWPFWTTALPNTALWAVTDTLTEFLLKQPSVDMVATINGIDITSMSVKSNYGTFFATLKPWSERKGPGMVG